MNLSSKLYITIFILAATLTVSIGSIFYVQWSDSLYKIEAEQQLEAAKREMNKIDRFLYERLVNIKAISSDELTKDILLNKHQIDQDKITREINHFINETGSWDIIRYVDMKGHILASNKKDEIGSELKDEIILPIYQKALLGTRAYSDAVKNKEDKLTILFASPVKDEDVLGRPVVGAVLGHLSWPMIQEILDNIAVSKVKLITNTGQNININHNDYGKANQSRIYNDSLLFSKIREQLAGNIILPDSETNEPSLISYSRETGYLEYEGNNWIMTLQTPMRIVNSSISSTTIPISALFLLIVVLGMGTFGFILRSTILQPINKLASAVGDISTGNLSVRADVRSNDEVGRLGKTFNLMAQKLQSYYGELEQRVAEKTKQLAETLENVQDQNVKLEDTKKAMLNLLEDAHELEDKLKIEKENVENKVKERTQELFQEKTKLTSSIENLPVGFMMVNVEADLIVVNNLTESILVGVQKMNFIDEIKKLLVGKIDLIEYIKKCGDHKKRLIFDGLERNDKILRILLSPILTGDKNDVCIGVVILLEDVTEAKIMERSKDEFFSIASHELRTPLTAIRGNASMILQYMDDQLKDPQLKDMIKDIHESSLRLIAIVNDFLNLSRLEQGKIIFKNTSVDMSKLINEVLKEMRGSISQSGIRLAFKEPPTPLPCVYADSNRIKEVLINLIGNSLKFTEKGEIVVSIILQESVLKILVTDSGRGIPTTNQNLLFHKFQQAGSNLLTRDTTKGTGLGLYISKLMIEGMGGKIALVQSIPGKGSIFGFTLPIMKNV